MIVPTEDIMLEYRTSISQYARIFADLDEYLSVWDPTEAMTEAMFERVGGR